MATYTVPNALSGLTRMHISRASYYFVGPDSPLNRQYPLKDVEGANPGPDVGALISWLSNVYLGTPVVGSASYVVNAAAISGASNATLNTANNTVVTGLNGGSNLVTTDVPRALQYVSSNSGDTTQTVTVSGYDQYKNAMTETVTLNGTNVVQGNKAFVYIAQVAVSATMTGNLSVGTSATLGLPMAVDAGQYEAAVKVVSGVQSADAGTLVFADRTQPATVSTGDVRGTYTPAVTLNGSDGIYVRYFPALGKRQPVGSTSTNTSTYGVTNT